MAEIEQKIEIKNKQPNIIEVDGVRYAIEKETTTKIDGVVHSDKIVYKKFDEVQYKKDLKILVAEISKQTTKEEILNEILCAMDVKTLKRLVRRIEAGKPVKKQQGCIGFKIGDTYVQVVD